MSEVWMMYRVTKLLLVVSTSAIASASIAPTFVNSAGAAEECLAKPKDGAPQGQHWRYRLDRNTKRQCWYLRNKDEAPSQAAASAPSEKPASLDRKSETSKNEPFKSETSMTRSTADAYAAWSSSGIWPQGGSTIQPVTQPPPVDAKIEEQDPPHQDSPTSEQSPVASRWPDSSGVLSPAIERPVPSSFTVASSTPDPIADAATAGPEISSTASTSSTVSLQMLLLAAFGALAFSGLAGGGIYVARARRRPLPDATSGWSGWQPPDDAYRLYAPPRRARPVISPRAAETHSVDRPTRGLTENGHEIAQLLARFADQAESER